MPGSGFGAIAASVPLHRSPEQNSTGTPTMDAEQINAIGAQLADLSQRTVELRGYL
jgi:hypothetical protein